MEIINRKKDDVIFSQGENKSVMYKVISGKVGIFSHYKEQAQKLLASHEVGDVFGEMAVLEQLPRSTAAVALCDVELQEISKDSFLNFIKENPEIAEKMMKNLSSSLRGVTDDYLASCKTLAAIMQDGFKTKNQAILSQIKKFEEVHTDTSLFTHIGENGTNAVVVPILYGRNYTMYI